MKPALEVVSPGAAEPVAQLSCVSCHFPVHGNFCAQCGEATQAHPPSAGEFVHEFVGHYVALEGKLWQTLRALLLKPGQLTAEHLRGRRVPYVNPLRLYLTLSLVVFALIKLVGVDLPQVSFDDKNFSVVYRHTIPDPMTGKPLTANLDITAYWDSTEKINLVQDAAVRLRSVNQRWAGNLQRFVATPAAQQAEILNQGFVTHLPYMLIGALPLFALYLKLVYWRSRRRYGEHLVFALHVSAFVFLLASVMMLIPGNVGWLLAAVYTNMLELASAWDWLQLLPTLWIVAYLPSALRRVYGSSRRMAWLTGLLLIGVHLSFILALIAGAEVMAVLRHG